jgi:dihydroorotate dehydrogenase
LTALIFEGPALVPRIAADLARLLRRDGFRSVSEAVGTAAGKG